ncbi:unnamed protein product [Ixodes persulcatus]
MAITNYKKINEIICIQSLHLNHNPSMRNSDATAIGLRKAFRANFHKQTVNWHTPIGTCRVEITGRFADSLMKSALRRARNTGVSKSTSLLIKRTFETKSRFYRARCCCA